MRCCRAIALAAVLVGLAPAALAADGFDPLKLSFSGFLTADGEIDATPAAPGSIPFQAVPPTGVAPPLLFTFVAPVRFSPGAAFEVAIQVRADALVVARDAEGNAFEIGIDPDGARVPVAVDPPVMAPGTVATLRVQVMSSSLYDEGDPIVLSVRPLGQFTDGALSLVVGGDPPSTFAAPDMRVPTPADLRLQDLPHTEFLLDGESFAPPPTHSVNVFRVGHASVDIPSALGWSIEGTYAVLRGDESGEVAAGHAKVDRASRIDAAHEFRVNGAVARVHPGLGVVVRIRSLPLTIECVRNCPADFAFEWGPPPTTPTGEPPSTLIPPPRDTSGIPVSEDEDDKPTPLAPLVAIVALALAAETFRRRR